jgi:hypothetical protein
MTPEQIEITKAYERIRLELGAAYKSYMQDALLEEYKDLTADDVYIWFIEGLS